MTIVVIISKWICALLPIRNFSVYLCFCITSRRLLCRSEKNARIPLYSIFINPVKHEEFAVGGRDHRCR